MSDDTCDTCDTRVDLSIMLDSSCPDPDCPGSIGGPRYRSPTGLGPTYDPPVHGTVNAYARHRCRCDPCRTAMRTATAAGTRRRRERERAATGLPDGDPRHGTHNGYRTHRCRCDRCRAWNAENCRAARARTRTATPGDPA